MVKPNPWSAWLEFKTAMVDRAIAWIAILDAPLGPQRARKRV
jgi:hypothetical protein